MSYIYPAPGVSGTQVTLKLYETSKVNDSAGLAVPAIQDITVNNANDVFTWTQLDEGSKLQIATTATNSLSMSIVVDQVSFFGGVAPATKAALKGIFGLSKDKALVEFELFLGKTDSGGTGKTLSGKGYVTGLAPTVSADSPVWTTPITITVTGDYTLA
jgi:hypothetical protein